MDDHWPMIGSAKIEILNDQNLKTSKTLKQLSKVTCGSGMGSKTSKHNDCDALNVLKGELIKQDFAPIKKKKDRRKEWGKITYITAPPNYWK